MSTVAEAIRRPYDNFTLVRLLLAVAVVVSHAASVSTGRHIDEPLYALTGYTLGEHGVNGFFAVSGFLVAMSWDRRGGPAAFAAARLLRVFPGLIVAVLVTALGIGLALTNLSATAYLTHGGLWKMIWQTLTTFKSATTLPGVFEQNPLRWPISTVWTLRYELLCYAGLLAAGVLGLFKRPQIVLAATAATGLALLILGLLGPLPKGQETSLRLPLIFATGALIYLYRDRVRMSWLGVGLILAIIASSAMVSMPLYRPLLFAGTAYLVLFAAIAPGLSHPRFEPPGDISYGVYLYGWPVQQALQALFPAQSGWAMLAPALLITAALATASWVFVEKPALRLKARFHGGPGR